MVILTVWALAANGMDASTAPANRVLLRMIPSLCDRREAAGECIDAPAKQPVGGETQEAQYDQRHEDLVDQHVHPRIPDHLTEAVVGGNELGRDDGHERVG